MASSLAVTIGVPLRITDPQRGRAWEFVYDHLLGTGFPVKTMDATEGESFNRAASRNALMASLDSDVVILSDADLIAPTEAYESIAELAASSGKLVVGYEQYRALSQHATAQVLRAGVSPWEAEQYESTEGWSTGGLVAMRPELWAVVGGMDERFRGWGCEDFAFAHAASVFLGRFVRTANPIVHFWHRHANADEGQEANNEFNGKLLAQYTGASTPEMIRAVQS